MQQVDNQVPKHENMIRIYHEVTGSEWISRSDQIDDKLILIELLVLHHEVQKLENSNDCIGQEARRLYNRFGHCPL